MKFKRTLESSKEDVANFFFEWLKKDTPALPFPKEEQDGEKSSESEK